MPHKPLKYYILLFYYLIYIDVSIFLFFNSNLQDKTDKKYFESTVDTTYIKASQSARVTNLDATSYIPLTASDFVTPSGNFNAVINAFGNISSFQLVTMSAQRDSNYTNLIQFYVGNVSGKKVFVTPTSGTSFPSAISHINISQNVVQIVFFNELTAGIDYSVDMLIIG